MRGWARLGCNYNKIKEARRDSERHGATRTGKLGHDWAWQGKFKELR